MLPWSPIENRALLWVYYEVVEDFVFCLHRLWTLADGKSPTSSSCPSIEVSSISEWPRALHLARSQKCVSSQRVAHVLWFDEWPRALHLAQSQKCVSSQRVAHVLWFDEWPRALHLARSQKCVSSQKLAHVLWFDECKVTNIFPILQAKMKKSDFL